MKKANVCYHIGHTQHTFGESAMSVSQYPTVDYLRQCFKVEDGKLFWLKRPRQHFDHNKGYAIHIRRFAEQEAGYLNVRKNGDRRWMICLDGKMYLRYRIIWAMQHGEWPAAKLDHRDRNPLNDAVGNLRPATQSQNSANSTKSKANTSGFKGVFWRKKTKKWISHIRANGKTRYLGQYDTPEEAGEVYLKASKAHFGEFACAG